MRHVRHHPVEACRSSTRPHSEVVSAGALKHRKPHYTKNGALRKEASLLRDFFDSLGSNPVGQLTHLGLTERPSLICMKTKAASNVARRIMVLVAKL